MLSINYRALSCSDSVSTFRRFRIDDLVVERVDPAYLADRRHLAGDLGVGLGRHREDARSRSR